MLTWAQFRRGPYGVPPLSIHLAGFQPPLEGFLSVSRPRIGYQLKIPMAPSKLRGGVLL
jgi:hypothetical protein